MPKGMDERAAHDQRSSRNTSPAKGLKARAAARGDCRAVRP